MKICFEEDDVRLRELEITDADFMLEWMHDEDVVKDLKGNFLSKTKEDAVHFIENSISDERFIHYAIVDENDEYMGTVSLKNIDIETHNAEFGISVRKKAMGKGYSIFGMKNILSAGMRKLELEEIYWCVSSKNERAVRFYDKHFFRRTTKVPERIMNAYSEMDMLIWYVFDRNDFERVFANE